MRPTRAGYIMLSIATLLNSITLGILIWSKFLG